MKEILLVMLKLNDKKARHFNFIAIFYDSFVGISQNTIDF